jgi:cytochrome c556
MMHSDILDLALSVYNDRADDLTAERARSKWLLAQIMKDAKPTDQEKWKSTLQEAQELREKVVGANESGQSEQEDYDNLVAYFYR